MAQLHAINGTSINYIGQPDWIDTPQGEFLNGETLQSRWRGHTWAANVMTESEFNFLYALEGQKVSLLTTKHNDRNGDYITYYGVDFRQITGTHDGPRFIDVQLNFMIRV